MNIQIFGTKKSFDTKKAQRYFKERRIKVQFIDLREKEMSKGELQSVMRAVGGIDALLDPKAFAVGTQQLSLDDFTPKVLPDAAPAVQKLAAAGLPARQAAYEVKQEALLCLTRRM